MKNLIEKINLFNKCYKAYVSLNFGLTLLNLPAFTLNFGNIKPSIPNCALVT